MGLVGGGGQAKIYRLWGVKGGYNRLRREKSTKRGRGVQMGGGGKRNSLKQREKETRGFGGKKEMTIHRSPKGMN